MNLFISQSVFNHQISFTEEKLSVETETSLFIYFFFAMLLGCGISQDTQFLLCIAASATIGGVVGGVVGLRAHNKNLKAAEDILQQIEELKR